LEKKRVARTRRNLIRIFTRRGTMVADLP
jgi:hypothetical protein